MKPYGYGLLGAASALCCLSLGGGFGLIGLLYGGALAAVFNDTPRGTAWSYLIGLTVGLELLSQSRFGVWSLFCFSVWMLDLLFRQRLRFTSVNLRFLLALLLLMISYHLLFSSGNALYTWLPLAFGYMLLALMTLLRRSEGITLSHGFN